MRGVIPIVFVMAAILSLVGCAAPRAAGVYISSQTELPIPPGGKQMKLQVQPSVVAVEPGWGREIDVPMDPDAAREWYEKKILEKGWKHYTGHTCEDGTVGADYQRDGWMIHESLSLEVRQHQGGSRISLRMFGDYWWDFPSKLPFAPFYWTLGESEAAIAVARCLWWL